MATIKCAASGCDRTSDGGYIFYTCKKCGAHFCSNHGNSGNNCPRNCGGNLAR